MNGIWVPHKINLYLGSKGQGFRSASVGAKPSNSFVSGVGSVCVHRLKCIQIKIVRLLGLFLYGMEPS